MGVFPKVCIPGRYRSFRLWGSSLRLVFLLQVGINVKKKNKDLVITSIVVNVDYSFEKIILRVLLMKFVINKRNHASRIIISTENRICITIAHFFLPCVSWRYHNDAFTSGFMSSNKHVHVHHICSPSTHTHTDYTDFSIIFPRRLTRFFFLHTCYINAKAINQLRCKEKKNDMTVQPLWLRFSSFVFSLQLTKGESGSRRHV